MRRNCQLYVWDLGVRYEGEVMYGNKFVYILSRKSSESLLVSYLKVSILKSSINIMFLISKESFCKKDFVKMCC